jgi:threonine dehydrogenase-like Zn-dependent dehydrogenase
MGCLLPYNGNGFYPAALAEPMSCVIGAIHASYHTVPGSYIHQMDIINDGNMAILGGVGPMGLAAINYVIHRKDRKPKLLVVTDIDQKRLDRAEKLYSPEEARKNGIELKYILVDSSSLIDNSKTNYSKLLVELTGGKGFDDVFVFAPVAEIIERGDSILAFDGCLNFFAGPDDSGFKANLNFYNIHYNRTHVMGTSGGNTDDMKEALAMMTEGLDPAGLVTHIGGLNSVISTTYNLPKIPGGKKLIYTNISLDLTAISEFQVKGKSIPLYRELAEIINANAGLWCTEAEAYLLQNADKI